MAVSKHINRLDQHFQKITETPAGFEFFVAIHDFIACVEANSVFLKNIASRPKKEDKELNMPTKYSYLRQIYQGLEDAVAKTTEDLGHARYMAVLDLNRIRNKELTESNFFWKKREVFRKLAAEVYGKLKEPSQK